MDWAKTEQSFRVYSLDTFSGSLTFSEADQRLFAELSGVSIDAVVRWNGESFRENLLFTHRGLSGPAILQISNYCRTGEAMPKLVGDEVTSLTFPGKDHRLLTSSPASKTGSGDAIVVDLLPDQSALELLTAAHGQARELVTVLSERLPRRFVQSWCARFAPSQAMNRYLNRQLEDIARRLQNWELRPAGTEGYVKAEVTLGGVDTSELSSKSMESRVAPGLFFIGEVVDMTGWLGGYNFQWAWASGFAAGQCA